MGRSNADVEQRRCRERRAAAVELPGLAVARVLESTAWAVSTARVKEDQRRAGAQRDLTVEAGIAQALLLAREQAVDRPGVGDRAAVDRRRQRRDARIARVEKQQALVREDRGQRAGERGRHGTARPIVGAQDRQDLARRRRLAGEIRERVEQRRDLGAEPAMRHRRPLQLGRAFGQRHPQRSAGSPGDGTGGDLGEVVVLGLQPEQGDAAHARLGFDGARGGDRGRGLVECVKRAEEQPHLLATHHHRSVPARQSFQVAVARGAGGQRCLLLGERGQQCRIDPPRRRLARRRHPHRALAEVAWQERRRGRFTGEVRRRECAAHRRTRIYPAPARRRARGVSFTCQQHGFFVTFAAPSVIPTPAPFCCVTNSSGDSRTLSSGDSRTLSSGDSRTLPCKKLLYARLLLWRCPAACSR
jgi:hypothetical protein